MRFLLRVLKPNKTLLQDHVDAVRVPAVDGEYELLADHAPVFLALNAGVLSFIQAGEAEQWFITGGTCHMQNNECVILVKNTLDLENIGFSEVEAELAGDDLTAERRQFLEAVVAAKQP